MGQTDPFNYFSITWNVQSSTASLVLISQMSLECWPDICFAFHVKIAREVKDRVIPLSNISLIFILKKFIFEAILNYYIFFKYLKLTKNYHDRIIMSIISYVN